jgi:hypothetical protein
LGLQYPSTQASIPSSSSFFSYKIGGLAHKIKERRISSLDAKLGCSLLFFDGASKGNPREIREKGVLFYLDGASKGNPGATRARGVLFTSMEQRSYLFDGVHYEQSCRVP